MNGFFTKCCAVVLTLAVGGALIANCGGEAEKPKPNVSTTIRAEVAAAFKGKTNPHKTADKAAVDAGKALFAANCVVCHGETGEGAAAMMSQAVPPANLRSKEIQDLPDDYLFYKVSRGAEIYRGGKGASPMTPFEHLPEGDRWKIIAYVRSLGAK